MFMHDTLGLLIIFRLVPFFPPNHNQVYTVFSHRTMDSCAGCIAREAVFFPRYMDLLAVIYFCYPRSAGWVCDHPLGHEVQERNS